MATPKDKTIVVGQFAGPHGVKGQFKVRSFTENPKDVASYGPVATKAGACLTLSIVREAKPGVFICSAPEIKTREDTDAFKGAVLCVPRTALPVSADDDEFYHADLIGLAAQTTDGQSVGRVKAVVNYGAGDILELIECPGYKGSVLVPFTLSAVPEIDLSAGTVSVILPDESDDVDDGASPA